jgi:hypothetical protein
VCNRGGVGTVWVQVCRSKNASCTRYAQATSHCRLMGAGQSMSAIVWRTPVGVALRSSVCVDSLRGGVCVCVCVCRVVTATYHVPSM